MYTETERYGHGVYAIVNKVNDWQYIGQTTGRFAARWQMHLRELRKGKHANTILQRDWNTYGPAAFEFRIVEALPVEAKEIDHLIAESRYAEASTFPLYNSRWWGFGKYPLSYYGITDVQPRRRR